MIIVNGKIHGKDFDSSKTKSQKVDEIQKESASNVTHIEIHSSIANIEVSACDKNDVSAHLIGNISEDQGVALRTTKEDNKIAITVSVSNSEPLFSYFITDLILKVCLPLKTFENILAENVHGNIVIYPINAGRINALCNNGNVAVFSLPKSLQACSKNGNINVVAKASCNSKLKIISMNGNIDVSLSNVDFSTVETSSSNGLCTYIPNSCNSQGDYTVSGKVSSKNGNVKFSY